MELHELQKMISIIHDKKPKCRGNLRVKVLLKSTHDYVRRSLIDDQLGNPESLETLLRNSGTAKETSSPVSSAVETNLHSMDYQSSSAEQTESDAMDCEQTSVHATVSNQELLLENNSDQNLVNFLNDVSSSTEELPECRDIFKITNNRDSGKNRNEHEIDKYLKLTTALQKVMKQWDQLVAMVKKDNSYLKYHYHNVKRMRKLLLECKVCFKSDFENQSYSQQQMIKLYLRIIKKMLKQCDYLSNYKWKENHI